MRLKYVGPHTDGVEVPELGGRLVAYEEIIDVEDEKVAKRLAESADWQVTSRTTKKESD